MKRKKNVIILLTILVFMVGAFIGVKTYNKHQDVIKNSGETIIEFNIDDVTHVDWTYSSSQGHSFTKTDEIWHYDGDEDFPVNSEVLEDLISELCNYSADFVIEEPDKLSSYGLSNSNYVVNIDLSNGTSISVTFGSYSSMDSERYFMTGDGKVYLALVDVMNDFYIDKDEFALEDEIPDMKQALSFTVTGDNNINIVYENESGYAYSDEFEYFVKSGNFYKAIDTDLAEDLICIVADLNLSSFETYTANTEDLSKWYLENPGLTVSIVYENDDAEQECFVLLLGSNGSTAYARIENSDFVYPFAEADYEELLNATYDSLRPQNLENIGWSLVSKIQVSVDSSVYDIEVSHDKKDNVSYKYNETEVSFDGIISSLDSIKITEFDNESSFKKKELGLVIYQDSDTYPQIAIDFYRVDGDYCMAFIMGQQIGTVSRDTVIDMVESLYDIVL